MLNKQIVWQRRHSGDVLRQVEDIKLRDRRFVENAWRQHRDRQSESNEVRDLRLVKNAQRQHTDDGKKKVLR